MGVGSGLGGVLKVLALGGRNESRNAPRLDTPAEVGQLLNLAGKGGVGTKSAIRPCRESGWHLEAHHLGGPSLEVLRPRGVVPRLPELAGEHMGLASLAARRMLVADVNVGGVVVPRICLPDAPRGGLVLTPTLTLILIGR